MESTTFRFGKQFRVAFGNKRSLTISRSPVLAFFITLVLALGESVSGL